MGFEGANPEQAKKHETTEECGVLLTDEQLKDLAGGASDYGSTDGKCPATGKNHYWYDTGETRPCKFGSSNPPDRQMRCKNCGTVVWQRVLMA